MRGCLAALNNRETCVSCRCFCLGTASTHVGTSSTAVALPKLGGTRYVPAMLIMAVWPLLLLLLLLPQGRCRDAYLGCAARLLECAH